MRATKIMAILNLTPDSFSGDGLLRAKNWTKSNLIAVTDLALRMEDAGADVIDIGGESTRPLSLYPDVEPVAQSEELHRTMPVVQRLKDRLGVPISIDTRKALVAKEVLQAGATIVNDVSMLADPQMPYVMAAYATESIICHNPGEYMRGAVVETVTRDLKVACETAVQCGTPAGSIWLDPGIGFGKRPSQNLEILRAIPQIKAALQKPLLVGTSRKSFIKQIVGKSMNQLIWGNAATVAMSIIGGADMVRVHDVSEMALVARMTDAMMGKV